ncbi:MAG: cysteine desulfurase, partial [Thermoprotei archaeon]
MMLSELLRKDFPILERKINGYPLIYFDNAASSLKPIQVVEEISNFYLYHYSNIHRGVHVLSEEATEMYEKSRLEIAKFINASPEEIIFVRNTTEAINLVSLHFSTCIQGNVNVVISDME